MPLPNDEKLIALSEQILKQLEAMFGPHPGFRPVHAKGILLTGTFTPSSAAASLTRAQHAVQGSTPVTVRFSDCSKCQSPCDISSTGFFSLLSPGVVAKTLTTINWGKLV